MTPYRTPVTTPHLTGSAETGEVGSVRLAWVRICGVAVADPKTEILGGREEVQKCKSKQNNGKNKLRDI